MQTRTFKNLREKLVTVEYSVRFTSDRGTKSHKTQRMTVAHIQWEGQKHLDYAQGENTKTDTNEGPKYKHVVQ